MFGLHNEIIHITLLYILHLKTVIIISKKLQRLNNTGPLAFIWD